MTAETRFRVRYAETDQMGIVNNANYLIYFEVGRVELMRQLGLDYKTLEQQQSSFLAVAEANCRYKAPARFDDELIVRSRIDKVRGSMVRFTYTIHRAEQDRAETLLTEGVTTHVVVDASLKRAPMPALFADAFTRAHIPIEPVT